MSITETPAGYKAECQDCGWKKDGYRKEGLAQKGLDTHQRLNCPGEEQEEEAEEEGDGGEEVPDSPSGDGGSSSSDSGGWSFPSISWKALLAGAVVAGIVLWYRSRDTSSSPSTEPSPEPEDEQGTQDEEQEETGSDPNGKDSFSNVVGESDE